MYRLKIVAVILTVAAPMANAWSNTIASVTVKNETGAEATFTYQYAFGSFKPSPSAIASKASTSFDLISLSTTASGMRFTYKSGRKECQFEASHSTLPTAKWDKKATSVGSTRATCEAQLTRASINPPYNYSVTFTLK
ncbi:hypothetical protein PS631_00790 [Pseudomonas fluorescens]|jgi:hypothetical protein|uniref:Uncharacterized protein n=1 Tax=Pseudomonas fluorescens TaxID=294 RepID=A0A5E6Q611_PSEFL|nr:hypothetical protein [Pseudomonas fluorescens]VVM50588.1 hypothetical protein PS631_00790 [Pseudomonas fluorescens]